MAGLSGTNQIREIDYLQDDATNWATDDAVNITLAHQSTAIADSEVNWEKSFKCLRITVSGNQSGDNVFLPVASWGDASPTLSTIPFAGCWIRADASGNVCDLIYNGDGTDVTQAVTIDSANRWQFVEFDLSSFTGSEVDFRINIVATSSVVIWISRVWYVQDSRQITGNIVAIGTQTDERITVSGNTIIASGTGATDLGRCLIHFQGVFSLASGFVDLQTTYSSCLIDGDSNAGFITKNIGSSGLIFDQDGSDNLFSGTENNEFVNLSFVQLPKYFHSNDDYNFIFVYGATEGLVPHLLAGYNQWDVFKSPRCYGCTTGISPSSSANYNLYTFNDMKLVSCGEGIDTNLAMSILIEGITFVNNTTKAVVDSGSFLELFDNSVDETTGFTFLQQSDGKGLFVYRSVNLVTDPVTASVTVRAMSTIASTIGYFQCGLHTTGITNGSGEITELWCLYKNRWTASDETIFSTVTDKWNFQFMKSGAVIADVDFDIVSGIGSVASPTTVSVTAVPSISNQQLDDFSISTIESALASCDVTNMTASDEVFVDINNGQFVDRLDTTDNAAYSKTIFGNRVGTGTSMDVTFYAVNTPGKDEQDALSSLTVTTATRTISDATLLIRNLLLNNVTDPESANRPANSKFVVTSWPHRPVHFPIIIVQHSGESDRQMGIDTESSERLLQLEVQVWAKNVKDRDELAEDVYTNLRTLQESDTRPGGYFDFKLLSSTNIDEPGKEAIHRKIMQFQYKFYT